MSIDIIDAPVEISDGVIYEVLKVSKGIWLLTVDFYGEKYSEAIEQETLLEKYMKINDVVDGIQKLINDKKKSILLINDNSLIVRTISTDIIEKLRGY